MNSNSAIDITGKRFTRLVALERDTDFVDKHRRAIWICCCDCGNTIRAAYGALVNGHTKSCGCLVHDKRLTLENDLKGRRFGSLLAVRPMNKSGVTKSRYRIYWLCHCDCGREIVASEKSLINGSIKSCGCVAGSVRGNVIVGNPKDSCWSDFPQDFRVGPVQGRKTSTIDLSSAIGVEKHRRKYDAMLKMGNISIYLGSFNTVDDAVEARQKAQDKCIEQILGDWRYLRSNGMEAREAIEIIKENIALVVD